MQPLLSHLFKGYNVTVLAYGQTCAGKTFTIGTDLTATSNESAGVIPRVLDDMFNKIESHKQHSRFEVNVSFVEIYNEEINDLFSLTTNQRPTNLEIREDLNSTIRVVNLNEITVSDAVSAIRMLKTGSALRMVGGTAMNEQSSRSHAIFTINLSRESISSGEITKSKFHLVDLAGSERQR